MDQVWWLEIFSHYFPSMQSTHVLISVSWLSLGGSLSSDQSVHDQSWIQNLIHPKVHLIGPDCQEASRFPETPFIHGCTYHETDKSLCVCVCVCACMHMGMDVSVIIHFWYAPYFYVIRTYYTGS